MTKGCSKAARNEIRKLRAAYINSVAIGILLIGLLTPYIRHALDETSRPLFEMSIAEMGLLVFWIVGCILLSFLTHRMASSFLEEIED